MIRKEAEIYMEWALQLAEKASDHGDVPVGAIVVDSRGFIVGQGKNERELRTAPEAHAEILAIRSASKKLGTWNLTGCELIVTLEPCLMCTGLLVQSRIHKVWFGAWDRKGGAVSSTYGIGRDNRTHHHFDYEGGILEPRCGILLTEFFRDLRQSKSTTPSEQRPLSI